MSHRTSQICRTIGALSVAVLLAFPSGLLRGAEPQDASAHSHLISAKPPYSKYNQPLTPNPDFPTSRNPAYLKLAQLMAQRTGETKPRYRPQPFNYVACIERYEALAAPDQRSELVKELANDLRQVAWQLENGPFVGKCLALDTAQGITKIALETLKDKEMALAIAETLIWPNYHLAGSPDSENIFTEQEHIQQVGYTFEHCGALDRAVVALKILLAQYIRTSSLNQADATRITLSSVYRKQKKYAEAVAILKEVTEVGLVGVKEHIPALEAAAEKEARAAKK